MHNLIDAILVMPEDSMLEFYEEMNQIREEEPKMAYITHIERQGIQKGLQQGLQQGIEKGLKKGLLEGETTILKRLLKLKFKKIPEYYLSLIEKSNEESILQWTDRVLIANSIEEIFKK